MIEHGTEIRTLREKIGLSQAKLAEAAGIPQHLLSAFELGKKNITEAISDAINNILVDEKKIAHLVERKKRYQTHTYEAVGVCEERSRRYTQTVGNKKYLNTLDGLTKHDARAFTGISLFSGCGGLSYGFKAAGFELKGYLEKDNKLAAIYEKNFPDVKRLGSDISSLSDEEIQEHYDRIGPVDIIAGGPPCQGFSLAGKRQSDDPRNQLFRDYMRFIDVFKPKVAIMENVRVLTSMKLPDGRLFKDVIISLFKKHGYNAKVYQVNAADYGVPQNRNRVIFVAFRSDLKCSPTIPEITHNEDQKFSFADACSDLPFIESGEKSDCPMHVAVSHPSHVIKWLWDVPEGASAHENEDSDLRPPSGYNTTYKRQVWNEPAATVQTTFGMISGCRNVHPIATRSLTVREAARIQSFPDSFIFTGSLGAIRTAIGNAVPPLLSYNLARHIRTFL